MISLLVQNFTPNGYPGPATTLGVSPPRICGAWVEVLPELAGKGEHEAVLSSAVKAFSLAILARGCDGLAPVGDARRAYGAALGALRRELSDARGAMSNVFIAAIMCLFLVEMLIPTDGEKTKVHAKGIEDLMQLCSPEHYASGDSHKLFAGFRPVLIIESLMTRRANFVTTVEWNTKPFCIEPMDPLQRLMTAATYLPHILASIKSITLDSTHASVEEFATSSLSQTLYVLERLGTWKRANAAFCTYDGSPRDEGAGLWFPDITAANCFTHFWSFWMICTEAVRRIVSIYPALYNADMVVGNGNMESLLAVETGLQNCEKILMGVAFCNRDEFKLFGAASAILPEMTAREALGDYGQRGADVLGRYQSMLEGTLSHASP